MLATTGNLTASGLDQSVDDVRGGDLLADLDHGFCCLVVGRFEFTSIILD